MQLDLADGATLAFAVGALVALLVAAAAVGFALWYAGDQTEL